MLKLKEFLVTTPMGGPIKKLAGATKRRIKTIRQPELDGFFRDDDYLDRIFPVLITDDSQCVDIGCHIGSVLKTFFDLAPKGAHLAVEPVPAKATSLQKHFPKAVVHQCALADQPGTAEFFEDTKNPGYSSLIAGHGTAGSIKAYSVPVRTLDEICQPLTRLDLIKIDVEGKELDVLRGGITTLAKHRPVLVFECGPVDPSQDHQPGDALFTHITETLSYDVFGAIDLVFGRPPLTLAEFRRYRTYPFTALNFVAKPRA
ncbi:MAG: FkbM family methyltransferase [Pseudomonadota bacterium]